MRRRPDGCANPLPMLGRDRDFLGAERPRYIGDTLPGKDALEDTAHNSGGFLVNDPFALVLFGRKIAIADAAGAAQPLFHSRLENGLDFPAGIGNIPLVYHIAEDGHNIKAVGGIQVIVGGDKPHMILVENALQQPHFDNITPDTALVFDNDRCHISRPDFFQHSVQPRTLESRSPHSIIGEVPDIRKAVLLGVVLQNTLLVFDGHAFPGSLIVMGKTLVQGGDFSFVRLFLHGV